MTKPNGIWALFSVENNYDQPNNNLIAWWTEKPTFEILAGMMGVEFKSDEVILAVVKCHQSEEVRLNNTDYRLEYILEGVCLG